MLQTQLTPMKFKPIAIALLSATSLSISSGIANFPFSQPALAQNSEAFCGVNEPTATYETRNFWIYICREPDGFRYVGVNKSTGDMLAQTAYPIKRGYQITNGNYTYIIDSQDLIVLEDGTLFSREPVIRFWYGSQPTSDWGTLRAADPNAQITLRANPSTRARSMGYGLVGDRVRIIEQTSDREGYTWYKVRFPSSGSVGWVRGDLLRLQ